MVLGILGILPGAELGNTVHSVEGAGIPEALPKSENEHRPRYIPRPQAKIHPLRR
jgi:hypothetical protein